MTDPVSARPPAGPSDPASVTRRLERKISASRLALAFERAWPRIWLPIGVVLLFLLASIAGLWLVLTPDWHKIGLGLFALAFLGSLVPLIRMSWPTREQALARLERGSGVPHRPASAYEDTLSAAGSGSEQSKIWEAHRSRMAALLRRLTVRGPAPRVERFDPLALRALMMLALIAGGMLAGDALVDRLASAFRLGRASAQAVATRLDAWVSPPVYTQRQPVLLADGAKPLADTAETQRIIEVPTGSLVSVRAAGPVHDRFQLKLVEASGAESEVPRVADAGGASASTLSSFRVELKAPATLKVLESGLERYSWRFELIPDLPPTISLTDAPSQGVRGALSFSYRVADDYGATGAEAKFELAGTAEAQALKLADGSSIEPIGEPPMMRLKVARKPGVKSYDGKGREDLTAHPWAGLVVRMTLSARDQAGQTGVSPPIEFLLPERRFSDLFARAVIEQRRKLAFMPARYREVAEALDAMTIAPERFITDHTVYLGLRTAYYRLGQPPSRERFESVVDQLWQIALRIEDGDLSEAERALREAQDRLAQALEDGAPPEEIERLMSELRQAMSNFMRSLAEQAQRNPQTADQQKPSRTMSSKDLEQMLDKLEKLARSGNKEAAQQLLNELRDLMERMQAGRMAEGGDGNQMMQLMEKFGGLITGQRQLLDDTFSAQQGRDGQPGKRGKQPGQGSGEGDQSGEGGDMGQGLEDRQNALRSELGRLLEDLKGFSEQGEESLNDAARAMGEAGEALGESDLEGAQQQQSQALEQLRKGAQAMTEQMMRGQQGQLGTRGGNGDRDPLGRPVGDDGDIDGARDEMVPRDIDVQRAREILEEVRRRLGEQSRPTLELDYLERLLKSN